MSIDQYVVLWSASLPAEWCAPIGRDWPPEHSTAAVWRSSQPLGFSACIACAAPSAIRCSRSGNRSPRNAACRQTTGSCVREIRMHV